jgi:hypothetical protein
MSAFTGLPDTTVSIEPDSVDTLTGTESSGSLTDAIHQTVPIKENPEIDSIQVCAYCGFQENFLGSQFVMGQTWHDWEYDQDTNFYQTSSGGPSSSTTPIILNKRGNRVKDDGKLWLPSSPEEAIIERSACQELNRENENEKTNKEYRDGTVIVHECCADYMAKYRYSALGRARYIICLYICI